MRQEICIQMRGSEGEQTGHVLSEAPPVELGPSSL